MLTETFRLAVHDLIYGVQVAGDGPALLLLHGFTGSASAWMPHLPALAAHFRTICVDLPGHGATDAPADPARYGMSPVVADLLAIMDRVSGGEGFSLLGYSMGGRVALHLALAAPKRVRALVLESASPGIADPAERAARRAADDALAERIEREGLDTFVRYWETLPLFATQARLPEAVRARQRAQRLASDPRGLANSLRGAGAGMQESLWDRLDRLTMPVLLVTGALDGKYEVIAAEMASCLPRAQHIPIPGSGHTPHLEEPDPFAAAIVPWLLEHASGHPT